MHRFDSLGQIDNSHGGFSYSDVFNLAVNKKVSEQNINMVASICTFVFVTKCASHRTSKSMLGNYCLCWLHWVLIINRIRIQWHKTLPVITKRIFPIITSTNDKGLQWLCVGVHSCVLHDNFRKLLHWQNMISKDKLPKMEHKWRSHIYHTVTVSWQYEWKDPRFIMWKKDD